jgi:hypothetical protein
MFVRIEVGDAHVYVRASTDPWPKVLPPSGSWAMQLLWSATDPEVQTRH